MLSPFCLDMYVICLMKSCPFQHHDLFYYRMPKDNQLLFLLLSIYKTNISSVETKPGNYYSSFLSQAIWEWNPKDTAVWIIYVERKWHNCIWNYKNIAFGLTAFVGIKKKVFKIMCASPPCSQVQFVRKQNKTKPVSIFILYIKTKWGWGEWKNGGTKTKSYSQFTLNISKTKFAFQLLNCISYS